MIIYDEVHSLLSPEFIKVLLLPLCKVIDGVKSELPYMIALSATYPSIATKEGVFALKRLNLIFGDVYKIPSAITAKPVYVWDYRNHYERCDKEGKLVKYPDSLGSFDSNYLPLEEPEAIEYFADKIIRENKISICSEYKGIIMTHQINSSVFAALYLHERFNCDTIIIRAANEKSILLRKDKDRQEYDSYVTLDTLTVGERINDYKTVIDNCCIIVGTDTRLKEGFSVENITWGICTKFLYSTIQRIQILGRVRRTSKNENLNKQDRIMYVVSGQVPSSIGIPNWKGKHKILYDFEEETELFKLENYIYI